MKFVELTSRHGFTIGLGALTTDIDWFLKTIENTDRKSYWKILKDKRMSKRKYKLVYQDEKDTFFVITDVYGHKSVLQIKEY